MSQDDRVIFSQVLSCTHMWPIKLDSVYKYAFGDKPHSAGEFHLEESTDDFTVTGFLRITDLRDANNSRSTYFAKLIFSICDPEYTIIFCSKICELNFENVYSSCATKAFELKHFPIKSLFKKIKSNSILAPKDSYKILLNIELVKSGQKKLLDECKKFECTNVIDENLVKLFENQRLCDVKLLTRDGKEISAHKAIIASRSEVFMKMFEVDMKEKDEGKVEINDIDYEELKLVINYMYTGKLDNIEEVALAILPVADKYNIEKLKLMCEEAIVDDLTVDTIMEILIVADTYRLENLKNAAIEFIVQNASEVIETTAYEEFFEKSRPNLIKRIIASFVKKSPTSK